MTKNGIWCEREREKGGERERQRDRETDRERRDGFKFLFSDFFVVSEKVF